MTASGAEEAARPLLALHIARARSGASKVELLSALGGAPVAGWDEAILDSLLAPLAYARPAVSASGVCACGRAALILECCRR